MRPGIPRRRGWIARGTTPLRSSNPERQAKRRQRYAAALRSAHTRALRQQVYEEQGGRCVCGQEPMTVLDHICYTRLGHELREDVQGLGPICNARETTGKRANWFNGARR